MHQLRIAVFICAAVGITAQGWARGCRPDVVRQDKITKQRAEIWTQVVSSTSFMSSLWKDSETTVKATIGRYGSVHALNLEIHKREGSLERALLESSYRGTAGKAILFGFKDAPPVELLITDVGNDARVAQGVFAAKAVTTVVLSAVLANDALGRLRDVFTSRSVDAIRVTLSGDVHLEMAVDEDTAEELMEKFQCFYKALDASGVVLTADASATVPTSGSLASVAGRYVRQGNDRDFAELRPDGSFSLMQQGMQLEGTYQVQGDAIVLNSPRIRGGQKGRIVGETIVDPQGTVWEKKVESKETKPITVEQVIAMVTAKLPEDVIVKTVKTSTLGFTLTPEILIQLKDAGVSDLVIRAMTP
jgi:hypothetical protein